MKCCWNSNEGKLGKHPRFGRKDFKMKGFPLSDIEAYYKATISESRSVMSDSLQPHESQHTSPPWPSPTPGVHSDSRPSSQWCRPAISSSVVPFSSCPQSLPASDSFPVSQLFTWGGQSTGVSALASFLPENTQGWSPSEWMSSKSNHTASVLLQPLFYMPHVPRHGKF